MVRTGLQRAVTDRVDVLAKKRVGLLVNPTAVDADLRHAVDLLAAAGADIGCLFAPEHGIWADAQDMVGVRSTTDPVTSLPVHSLYGDDEKSLAPEPAWLLGLDAVVYDIQDIGSRYYTFVWTLLHVMRACSGTSVQVVVLDRPNPLGGAAVEGGGIEPEYFSFVGRMSVPNRHGLTAGEIALWARDREQLDVDLVVIGIEGWHREQLFEDTGLPWVPPSPNMPTLDTALVYPGMCLVEGTELSEGRGTTRPFELVGAPFVDMKGARALAAALASEDLPGVRFRPVVFTPQFQKHAGKACGGVQLHVRDRAAFRPYLTGVAVLRAFKRQYPDSFQWRTRAYEFVTTRPAIDLLTGSSAVREGIDAGRSLAELQATWAASERALGAQRERYFIYR